MSLVKNKRTGNWEGDFRSPTLPRLHVSMRTTNKAIAMTRHAAVAALVREGHRDLVDRLRRGKLTVEAIEACVRQKRPFESLRDGMAWPTVGEAATAYLAWLETLEKGEKRAENTVKAARSQLAKVLDFMHDDVPLRDYRVDELPSAAVDAITRSLRESYAPGTVTDTIMRVSALYTWLGKREAREAREGKRAARVLHSPVDPETQPREKPTRERFLLEFEIQRLLAATPDALRWPILCGLLGGLRVAEMLYLRRDVDVDLEAGVIYVQKRPGWKPKRGKEREVPMTDELRAAAEHHLARYAGPIYMTVGEKGGRLNDTTFAGQLRRIVERAGLVSGRKDEDGVTFHTFRHTFASHLVMRGVDLYTVAQLLGDTLATVETTYAHLAPDHKRQAVQRLAGLLAAVAPGASTGSGNGSEPSEAETGRVTTSATTDPQNGRFAQAE